MKKNEIIDDSNLYGSKGQSWSEEFVTYMKAIVTHPTYSAMPDAIKDDGKIQWEAPSNRSSGQYQHTHIKRKDWWRAKAESIGIDTSKDQWISKTAKLIHPTGKKPCKRCGEIMVIGYVYPTNTLVKRLKKYIGSNFEVSLNEPIYDLVQRAYDLSDDLLISSFKEIFKAKDIQIPEFNDDLDEILTWLNSEYIPKEPSTLSPGAMSNAPDRFDGFHSFNRCCRGKADTGRSPSNLKSYTTDRRVFEYWTEGNWIASDRLMGLVRTELNNEATADGGKGPPTADHIGPISLGFCHRPEFKLLSKEANSAKNNRMSLEDVLHLIQREKEGIVVASWYATPLWNLRKKDVLNDEQALRLSKMLRDNQRHAMKILSIMFDNERFAFLIYLLELEYSNYNFEFTNLRAENFITKFDELIVKPRTTKYSNEQKARRIRIGFEALKDYMQKNNRFILDINNPLISHHINNALRTLTASSRSPEIMKLDADIKEILYSDSGIVLDELKKYASLFPIKKISSFEAAKDSLYMAMYTLAKEINLLWDDDRYVRTEFIDNE